MSPITADYSKNFQSALPLSGNVIQELVPLAFALGDSDPRSIIGPGSENLLRLEKSLAEIASSWGLRSDDLFVIPDRSLAYYLAIHGLCRAENFQEIRYSTIERKELLANIRSLEHIAKKEISVALDGQIQFSHSEDDHLASFENSLTVVQLRNGETGIWQRKENLRSIKSSALLIDATSAAPWSAQEFFIPDKWQVIILDSVSWGGPQGVYFLAINPRSHWKNPLPSLEPQLMRFGASYPLTIFSALSLSLWQKIDHGQINQANSDFLSEFKSFESCDLFGEGDRACLSFLNVPGDELVRRLSLDGFLVDSGSACSATDLEPSHVLAAMGALTHGNIRARLRPANIASLPALAERVKVHVSALREELL